MVASCAAFTIRGRRTSGRRKSFRGIAPRRGERPGQQASQSADAASVLQVVVFLALAFSIVIAIFAVQNTTPVAVQFLGFRADAVAVSVLVLISAAFGAAAMLLLGIAREVTWRWRWRGLNQQHRQAQTRLTELEKPPLEKPASVEPTPATTSPAEPSTPQETKT